MQNTIKKIIIILTIIILILGVFFGYKFYKNSKTNNIDTNTTTNTDRTRTPFQTKTSTSTEINNFAKDDVTSIQNPTTTISTRLTQLWKEPVSGFDFVYKDIDITSTSTENSTSTNIKNIKNKKVLKNQEYIYLWDRKTGHIYENLASTTEIVKISNYTLPAVEEAYFVDNSSVIVRKLFTDNETISTSYIKLNKESSLAETYTSNIKDIDIDSNNISLLSTNKRIFYFMKKTGKGVLSSFDGLIKTNTLNTTLTEWLPQYVNKNTIALTTKPSFYFKGYLFFTNTDGTGKNKYIIGEKYGFNALVSPDEKKIIYNEIINDVLETFIYDIKTKSLTYLRQSTLVDKCVWSIDSKKIFCAIPQKLYQSTYPDSWYKNSTSFDDNIWSINPQNGDFDLVVALQDQTPQPIDVYKIKISDTNKYLIFQDKNTLNLWKYDL